MIKSKKEYSIGENISFNDTTYYIQGKYHLTNSKRDFTVIKKFKELQQFSSYYIVLKLNNVVYLCDKCLPGVYEDIEENKEVKKV